MEVKVMSKIIEKLCTGPCGLVKPLSEFSVQRHGPLGRRPRCKVCTSKDDVIYRQNNSEKLRKSRKTQHDAKYKDPIHGPENLRKRREYESEYRKNNPDIIAQSRLRHKEKAAIQAAKYRKANAVVIKVKQAQYYRDNTEHILTRCAKYCRDNKGSIAAYHSKHYQANKKAILAKNAQWYKDNPNKARAKAAKRRAAKLQRLPAWADLEKIKEIYKDCEEVNLAARTAGCPSNEKFVVDHVIPLQGKLVSGLHVHTNLQIITLSENSSKGNKFIPG